MRSLLIVGVPLIAAALAFFGDPMWPMPRVAMFLATIAMSAASASAAGFLVRGTAFEKIAKAFLGGLAGVGVYFLGNYLCVLVWVAYKALF
jgi:hypothetical protein